TLKQFQIQCAGGGNAECAIGAEDAVVMDDSTESSGQFVEDPYFQTALPGPWRHKDWQPGSERIAYGPDTASLGRSQQRPPHPGENMRVLDRAEVRNRDPGRLKPTNRRGASGCDLFPLEQAAHLAVGE